MENNPVNTNIEGHKDDSLRLQDIYQLCLAKWKWFVVSVVVCLGVAVFYLMRTTPVYTRSASLLIKEDSKGNSVTNDMNSQFSDLGLFSTSSNVYNEVISLRSPAVMYEVVKRLGLDVSYTTDGRFRKNILYGKNLPYTVRFPDIKENDVVEFTLKPAKDSLLSLSNFVYYVNGKKEKENKTVKGAVGDTIMTPAGRVVVGHSRYPNPEFNDKIYVHRSPMQAAVGSCSKKLSVSLDDEKSTVIDLIYKDESIQRAEEVLNTVIGVYNENWVKDKNQIAVSTSMFINDRLGVIEGELGNVDEDISSYKSEHMIPDVEAASSIYMNESSENTQKITELNTQLSMARYIRNYLTNGSTSNQLLPVNSGLESANIESQITEYNRTQLQRNNLVSNSSEQNPLVQDLDQSLAAMRSAIMTSIDNLEASLNAQIRSLEQSEMRTSAKIAANPDQAKYLLSVERQQKVKESLYLFLLQKREENELSQAFTAYNSRVITPPSGSMIPTSPNKRNVLLLALLCGLLIPIAWIVIKESLNTTVRGKKDLETLPLPYLGEIPQNGKKRNQKQEIVVKPGDRDSVNEAFRIVRTNFEFMFGKNKGANATMVVSLYSGSGKTFISSNLGMTFAIRGKKVLLADLDIRKANLSEFVGSPKVGLTDYLNGNVENIEDVIVKRKLHENIDVLPVGTIPPNPTELLSSPRLEAAGKKLRPLYDYIFLDCPPVGMVADSEIIAKIADHTIFVVRAGLFSKDMLPEVEDFYRNQKFNDMTIVLNGTENEIGHYYGHYGHYGYGHYGYYGYGYGDKGTGSSKGPKGADA